MLANLLRRSSSSTTECVDAMELPRLHRVAYLKDSDGLRAMLGKDGVNIDKRDRNGRYAMILLLLYDETPTTLVGETNLIIHSYDSFS